jgi:hypothetical protein
MEPTMGHVLLSSASIISPYQPQFNALIHSAIPSRDDTVLDPVDLAEFSTGEPEHCRGFEE